MPCKTAKSNKFARCKYLAAVAISAIAVLVVAISTAYAAAEFTTEQQDAALKGARSKMLYSALETCYNRLQPTITSSGVIGWSDIFKNDSDNVGIPTSLYPDLNDSTLKCSELIGGWHGLFGAGGNFNGIGEDRTDIPINSNGGYSNKQSVLEFLKKIGYEMDEGNDDNLIDYSCVHYYIEGEYVTDKICAKLKDDGVTVDTNYDIVVQPSSYYDYEHRADSSDFTIVRWSLDGVEYSDGYFYIKTVGGHSFYSNPVAPSFWDVSNMACDGSRVDGSWSWSYNTTGTWCWNYGFLWLSTGHFKVEIKNDTFTINDIAQALKAALYTIDVSTTHPSIVKNPIIQEPYQPNLTLKSDGLEDFMKFFLGDKYTNYNGELTQAERYMLYYNDLTSYFNSTATCDFANPLSNEFGVKAWLEGTTFRTDCVVGNKSGKAMTAVSNSPGDLQKKTVKEIVALINSLDFDDDSFGELDLTGDAYEDGPITTDPDPGPGAISETNTCFNSASSLGWILCPVLKGLSGAMTWIYNTVIAGEFLEVEADLMQGDGALNTAWGSFQTFANIVFIIIFMIVIISQLTGFGISNYGIKKILPRLIMLAIIVNLSYMICQALVDLSNIVGYELETLLGETISTGDVTVASFGANLMEELFSTAVTGVVSAGIIALAVSSWEFWLMPLLLFLLGAIIGVIFFAILLGVRKAGILILVAVAPIAIACYALPNTKTIFDRWFKLFTALLLVFPICGLLMGGGIFASNLLLTVGSYSDDAGFFYQLVAMLVQVVPIFFIPTVVKSSFAAMGNLGMKLTNLGARFSHGVTGAIRGSDAYKDTQLQLRGHNAERYLNREQWNRDHRILGMPGRALNRVGARIRSGDGRIAKMAKNSYDRRNARAINAALSAKLASQSAEFATGRGYGRTLETAMGAAHRKHINEMASDIELANASIATNEKALQERHAEALQNLMADQSDENMATVQAYQKMLVGSDDGRKYLYNNFAKAAVNLQDDQVAGYEMAAQHLMREHIKDFKPNNRDFFSLMTDASSITSRQQKAVEDGETLSVQDAMHSSSFSPMAKRDKNGELVVGDDGNPQMSDNYSSTHYASQGIASYDAAALARADEGSIDRLITQAHSGLLSAAEQNQLEDYTRTALMNPTIHVQGKIATKLNKLRSEMGFSEIKNNSRGDQNDSGPLPVPHGSGRGSSDAQVDAPTVLRNPDGTILGENILRNPGGTVSRTDSGIYVVERSGGGSRRRSGQSGNQQRRGGQSQDQSQGQGGQSGQNNS